MGADQGRPVDGGRSAPEGFAQHGSPIGPQVNAVYAADDADLSMARELSSRLGVPLEQGVPGPDSSDAAALVLDAQGLSLSGGGMVLRGDFMRLLPRLRPDRLHSELLVRVAKVKGAPSPPTAVDATAGLGEDACLLAAAGFSVVLYERDAVIAALLRDALRRAADEPALARIVGRMELREQDSIAALRTIADPPDVVLLDPMFPKRTKSAAVKKKAQFLQLLERPCTDEEELLQAALSANPRKVVVKRPVKGPHLAGIEPAYSIAGKAVRYDCIVPPRR